MTALSDEVAEKGEPGETAPLDAVAFMYRSADVHGQPNAVNEDGRFMFDNYRDVCVFEGLQLGAGLHIDDLTMSNPLGQPDWPAPLAEQRFAGEAPPSTCDGQ